MAKTVVLDEVFVTVRIPAALPAAQVRAARRTLSGRAYLTALTNAVRRLVRSHPELAPLRLTLSR